MARKVSGGAVEVQGEMDNLPDRSKLGKAAIAFFAKRREIEQAQAELDGLRDALIKEFVASSKTQIKVEGALLFYTHTEKDLIRIKAAE